MVDEDAPPNPESPPPARPRAVAPRRESPSADRDATEAASASEEPESVEHLALRLALRSGDGELAEAVGRLLADRGRDRERLARLESYLLAALDQAGDELPGAAVLRALLDM